MSPLFDRPPIDAVSVSNTLFSSGTFRLTGGPGIVVGSDASGASIAATGPSVSYFDNMGGGNSAQAVTSTTATYNTLNLFPLSPFNELFPGEMTVSTLMFNISHSALTATASSSAFTSSILMGLYTMSNSTRLDLVNSVAVTFSKAANAGNTTLFSGGGARWFTAHSSQWSSTPTLSQGRYWVGVICRSSNFNVPMSSIGQFMLNTVQRMGTFGTSAVTNTGMGWFPFMGIWSASQSALPASVAASGVNQASVAANWIPHIVFNNRASAF